jgi:MerR family transcriptional regulator, light-induced transcriptional regulator
MRHFTIKDIEKLTGIKATTLHQWEKRFGFLSGVNDAQQKKYNNDALCRLIRIALLFEAGGKIEQLAAMDDETLSMTVQKTDIAPAHYHLFILQLMAAGIHFESNKVVETLLEIKEKAGFENCVTKVCHPLLQRIASISSNKEKPTAVVPFLYFLINNFIISETNALTVSDGRNVILLFSPQQQQHQLQLFFIQYLFKKNGWNVLFLGSGISLEMIKPFAGNLKISHVFIYAFVHLPDDYFEAVCSIFKTKKVIASGAGTAALQRKFVNLILLKWDTEIHQFIRSKNQALGST